MSSLPLRRLILLVSSFALAFIALASIYSLTLATPAQPADIIIVNPGDSIQTAINSANPGDTLLINAGRYTESLTLSKAVSLTGVSSTTVILHAVPNQRVITVTGATITNSVVISGLTITGGDVSALPDGPAGGLLIENGAQPILDNIIVVSNAGYRGGGIYAFAGSELRLNNVQVLSNTAVAGSGGGVLAEDSVTLNGGRFENNHSPIVGGMRVTGGSLDLTGTEFIGNSVGGLRVDFYSANIIGARFERNNGYGLSGVSGLISDTQFVSNTGYGAGLPGNVTVINSRFEQNTGGGLSGPHELTLTDSIFVGNTAWDGAGVSAGYTATVSGGRFERNTATYYGGGLAAVTLFLSGTQFLSNTAQDGGGVYTNIEANLTNGRFENNQSTRNGGGLRADFAVRMTNTTFVNNSATNGGAVYQNYYFDPEMIFNSDGWIVNSLFARNTVSGTGAALYLKSVGKTSVLFNTITDSGLNSKAAVTVFSGTVGITDTIIANHAVGVERIDGTVYEDYNLFFGNMANVSGTISGGTHDVFGNPNFVDPANGDYHIVPPSAAIDAGTDVGVYIDLDGNVRPSGGGFDMGAYESTVATTPISGLVASNSGPTAIGQTTFFTATIDAGDLVSYHWNFGDGTALGTGATVPHDYSLPGSYTAIVTATNSLSTVTATTTVTIYVTLIAGLTASNSSPTVLGQATAFTASINAGDLVSYTWNFGDSLSMGTGITSTHTYSTVGVYTATVTAVNSVSLVTATTRVTITDVPLFSEVSTPLVGVYGSSVAWGDYDNDGWLDILLTGYAWGPTIAAVYHNNGDGTFTDIGAELAGVSQSSAAWGDYDNDGWLDILLTGHTGLTIISKVYHNNGNSTFTDIGAGLAGIEGGAVAWGDYDNDGWLDILLTGRMAGYTSIAKVYHNNGDDTFTDIGAGLAGVYESSVAWGDYDNDGRLDILLTGYTPSWTPIFNIYHNNGNGTFTDIGAGLTEAGGGSVAWGDYDNDGWLDILLTGDTAEHTYIAKVYHNNGNGTFTDIDAGLAGAISWGTSVAWGDYDNDGWLDILLGGDTGRTAIATVYHNNSDGTFTDIGAGLAGVSSGSVAWGDYDNDGRLDILVTGDTGDIWDTIPIAKVYHNNISTTNSLPAAPTGLSAAVTGTTVNLIWDAAADNQTPTAGLTYNLRVGTTPGGTQIAAPMADTATGFRRVPQIGNANLGLTATLNFTTSGTYYWSVQAIDTVWAGSAFAAEGSFIIVPLAGVTITGPTSGAVNTTYTFTATASPITATTPITYAWNFGDGSLIGMGITSTHTYSTVGVYTATVTAVNSVSVVSATTRVTITDVPLSGLSAENNGPTLIGGATTLTATISAGSNVTYTWNFGDGSATAGGITTTHAYPVGIYTASVTAQNSVSVMTATTRVTVMDVPVSGLSATNSSPTNIGNVTILTATISAGSNVTYTWNFGDGSSAAVGPIVTHTYPFSVTSRFTATITALNTVSTQSATTTIIIVPRRVYLPVIVR